ncbi:amino acid ABC transporter permease [Paracoccus shanxieyensis]|uniref:ABC transporter permease subunit n=1 Tax=Paracoccus shanxieyensis TaxID=2675752 RepID=A0A6L6IXK7_9RHOB|nr:amino acid ABC transporter permease [Paracoccus shanxieyensis]MTH64012.1 ABC transporter permease subunit [Paracoccus shanxieyensis]MTH86947.1 ABC transporter permease subunit [Paracoccus shanxieyensis]
MDYQWDFSSLWQYRGIFAVGLGYTIGFTILTVISGLLVGTAFALARLSGLKVLTIPIMIVTELFRCTPVLVQLVWCYYALPMLIGVSLSPALAAFITLTMYGAAFYAEIVRGGIASIDMGQWDAGRAIGMRRGTLMGRIILPQALRRMVAPLVNQSVLQLKNTSLLSVLAVPDLLYQGQLVTSATYRPLETYTLIAALYMAVLFPMTRLAQRIERRRKA